MPHSRILRRTRKSARKLRRLQTDAERRLWWALHPLREQGMPLRRQAPIGPDIASLSLRLVIEVDGGQHAENQADAARTAWLESQGFRVIRFWNNDVMENVEACYEIVAAVIEEQQNRLKRSAAAKTPPPTPPHKGEGR